MLLKIALFVLIFASVYLLWELFNFIKALVIGPENYKMTTLRRILIGLSISYIGTIIFTGF